MSFDEALERFARVKPKEVNEASRKRGKRNRREMTPPDGQGASSANHRPPTANTSRKAKPSRTSDSATDASGRGPVRSGHGARESTLRYKSSKVLLCGAVSRRVVDAPLWQWCKASATAVRPSQPTPNAVKSDARRSCDEDHPINGWGSGCGHGRAPSQGMPTPSRRWLGTSESSARDPILSMGQKCIRSPIFEKFFSGTQTKFQDAVAKEERKHG
jgi:hypothetical protein